MTKEERKEYQRQWRAKNRDKVNAAKKRYFETHPEQKQKHAEYYKEWAANNRERLNEYARNYYRRRVVAIISKEAKRHE